LQPFFLMKLDRYKIEHYLFRGQAREKERKKKGGGREKFAHGFYPL